MKLSQELSKKLRVREKKLEDYRNLKSRVEDAEALIILADEEGEQSLDTEIESELRDCEALCGDMRLKMLLTGKYDANDAILTIHAGAGGTEAQDWAEMLSRMYSRYAEKNGYAVRVLDRLEGDEAGIKSITFEVDGINAYGYLKAEKGVHRLVRISPFDANSRRHTSFASLEVMPVIENDDEIKINPQDLEVDTYRSSGAGGQHVNKTESAIRITHKPTGIVVQCQNERSQIQNREVAMRMLMSKLIERREREQQEQANQIKGDLKKIEWGSQIRSYVFHPYNLVKDHRTGYEMTDITAVMDGDIQGYINEYLRRSG